MLVFIDESGDSGFKIGAGSSPYFVIAAVVFSSNADAQACEQAIVGFRREQQLRAAHEFHFTHSSTRLRIAFFRRMAQERFSYYGYVIDKRRLRGVGYQHSEEFYTAAVKFVCENARPALVDAKIIIDRCGDRQFARRLDGALRSRVPIPAHPASIRKVVMQDSHSNDLLQLTDMICGAIRCRYAVDRPQPEFCKLIEKREDRIYFWLENNKAR